MFKREDAASKFIDCEIILGRGVNFDDDTCHLVSEVECQARFGIGGCTSREQEIVDFLCTLDSRLWYLELNQVVDRIGIVGIVGIERVSTEPPKPHWACTNKLVGIATSRELHVVYHPCR